MVVEAEVESYQDEAKGILLYSSLVSRSCVVVTHLQRPSSALPARVAKWHLTSLALLDMPELAESQNMSGSVALMFGGGPVRELWR